LSNSEEARGYLGPFHDKERTVGKKKKENCACVTRE